ncbi:MAG TPA: NAD(P)/FAD-dependent oxidoreductase [Bryobacteraceae bacterium]|nr:NAD(P)/FAD-dependent oxidoreductase [Bryobacteraceae bacterium]HXJ42064.1 NAD(P)/FAD-dependent oxidoreductase [Bryobacteraceae bacterium]
MGVEFAAPVVILGAGPAGLSAAHELAGKGVPSTVLEQDSVVGGLARTVEYNGYRFDIGGHRFFTKLPQIEKIWKDVLGEDLLVRPRLSRIFYRGKFFQYPLEPLDALIGLGPVEALRCLASFARARLAPSLPEDDLETWLSNRFGRRLFHTFFESYTEKVWGLRCSQIQAEWGKQRIRGLSLATLLWNSLGGIRSNSGTPKTLIRQFFYPRLGPGMMWSRMRELIERQGARVVLNAPVEEIRWESGRVTAVRAGGTVYAAEHFISSIPIRELIGRLIPPPPEVLHRAIDDFNYRDFIVVALIIRCRNLFADNWIYIHDPNVAVGRIQNYGNWSPEMTRDSSSTCLGFEYFCQQDDALWKASDEDLVARAAQELAHLGLAGRNAVIDAKVVRVPKAYPVYDGVYRRGVAAVREFLHTVPNLQLVGRNGMHRYNNQDHSMLTAILAARNVMGANHNLWDLESDSEYLEDGPNMTSAQVRALEETQPRVPRMVASA